MKKLTLFFVLFVFGISQANAQAGGEITPKGITFPRYTDTNRPTGPIAVGTVIFNTTQNAHQYWNGSAWPNLATGGGSTNYWQLNGANGNEITNSNTGGFWSKNATLIDYNSPTNVNPPISGAGTRLMWVSGKAAFRAGTSLATDWDNTNMGVCSFATGYNSKASGFGATAMGSGISATGNSSVAIGNYCLASNDASVALGNFSGATGTWSAAIGNACSASGTASIAIGNNSTSNGDYSTAIDGGYISDKVLSHSLAIGPGSIVNKKNQMVTTFDEYRFKTYSNEILITNNEINTNKILMLNGSVQKVQGAFGYLNGQGNTGLTYDYNSTYGVSLQAQETIVARQFHAFSDARHKKLLSRSNGASDLALLNQLKLSNYTFIDTIGKGGELQMGFIAQEVEKIVPEAINKIQDYIPSIYDMAHSIAYDAAAHTLTVTTHKAHDFQAKDKIKLISLDKEHKVKVESIIDAHTFVVAHWENPVDKLFVFGKRVDDFRTVDYDRLFMLGISSIQELSRKIEKLEKENVLLKAYKDEFTQMKNEVVELKAMISRTSLSDKEMDK